MLLYALYLFKRKKKILDEKGEFLKKMYLLQKTKIKYSDDGQRWTMIMEKKKLKRA